MQPAWSGCKACYEPFNLHDIAITESEAHTKKVPDRPFYKTCLTHRASSDENSTDNRNVQGRVETKHTY